MMASVSRAGMSCRRADAAPDKLRYSVRIAHTRNYCNYHTRTHRATFPWKISLQIQPQVGEKRKITHFDTEGFFRAGRDKDSGLRLLRGRIYSVKYRILRAYLIRHGKPHPGSFHFPRVSLLSCV